MADTILGGDLTVYYFDENRRKQIRWTGGSLKSDTRIQIDVYDATEDLMTQPDQSDDGLIFDAPTPGEFIIGKIDAGDNEPWFIDLGTVEHLRGDNGNFTGCAIRTSGWARVEGSNTGIIVVPISSGGSIVKADIGFNISANIDGDIGTLLDIIVTGGATDYLWIRPDSNAAANSFDNSPTAGGTLTCNANTATQSAASITGEMVWGNVFSSGALVSDTHVFIIQNQVKISRANFSGAAQDWWPDGHIDRAIPIRDWTTSAFPTIDAGFLTVKANQYGTNYFPIVIRMNTTSGGNVSAGLTSGNDITNNTGYASILLGGDSGNFSVGDEISGDTSGARAKITLITGTTPTRTLHYYLVGDPLTDFNGTEAITNEDDTGAATSSGAPAAQGPALASWFDGAALPTLTYTHTLADVDDDATNEEYGIAIDVNQASLAQLTEYLKYIARRGSVFAIDGVDGEQWIGLDLAIEYSGFTATINEGDIATGATSGATATVVSFSGSSPGWILLRNSRNGAGGAMRDDEVINFTSGGNISAAQTDTVQVIVPQASNSFGTLAGTTLFLTRGIVLFPFSEVKSSEENLWSTIDSAGATKARPASISINMLNLLQHDWATWFRLTGVGGDIDKTEYSATGGETFASSTLTVDSVIAADVPNKTNGGRLVLIDVDDNNQEYVLRFSSFVPATGVITLAQIVIAAADGGTDTDTIVESGVFTAANVKVGDLVYNNTRSATSYVVERTDDNTVQIFPAIAGQTTGDEITINAIPGITVNTADSVFFALMMAFRETAGTESASMVFVSPIESLARLRNTSNAATKIKGQSQAIQIGSGGSSANLARIPNTVYGS